MKILFFSDIVGRSGRRVLKESLEMLKEQYEPEVVIANGENAAGGLGLDLKTADEIFSAGIEIITSGNHIWSKREIKTYLDKTSQDKKKIVLRPANFPKGAPGVGHYVYETKNGFRIGVLNLMGRVFIPDLVDCPFRKADELVAELSQTCDIIFVDFHAEATSEKMALGHYLDGRVSAVVGTHTHVQTADEKVLAKGTAYISDVGMCGPADSVLGVNKNFIIERFLTARPSKFEVAAGPAQINAVLIEVQTKSDEKIKKAINIQRINFIAN